MLISPAAIRLARFRGRSILRRGVLFLSFAVAACGQPPSKTPDLELAAPPATPTTSRGAGQERSSTIAEAVAGVPPARANSLDSSSDAATEASSAASKPPGNTVTETRSSQVIATVVRHHRKSVRACYEAELQRDPKLRGSLTVAFTIDPQGRVTKAHLNEARSTLTQPALVDCATAAVRAMRFPASSRGFESTVNYPFDFRP